MACACTMGNWSTGRVNVQNVNTEHIKSVDSFLGMKGKHGKDGFWPEPKVTDSGVESNANWASAAATGVAAINTAAAVNIANRQHRIAKDYYNLARDKWDRFLNGYAACERAEVMEACTTPEYETKHSQQAADYVTEVNRAYATVEETLSDTFTSNSICIDEDVPRVIALSRAAVSVDSMNFAYRYEESRKVAKDDMRWNRRQQSLNRGRDIQAQAMAYAKAAAGALDNLGNTIGQAAQGAMSAIGYFSNRNDTRYPQRMQMPTSAEVGDGFVGGWQGQAIMQSEILQPNIGGYSNLNTTYTSPDVITSAIGGQQPSGV